MLDVSNAFRRAMTSPVRTFAAEVRMQENANNPSVLSTYTHEDRIKSIEIQRVGDNSKFFGYGVAQRLSIDMVDLPDSIQPISKSSFKVKIGIETSEDVYEYVSYPTFYLSEKSRHEEDGDITLIAYDKIYDLSNHTVSELGLVPPYTIKGFISSVSSLFGLGVVYEGIGANDYLLNLSYEEGANFEGTENLRDALNMAAEAITAIYFIDYDDKLRFKRLDVSGAPVATISPDDYFSLSHSDNRRLVSVAHVTELGDNVATESSVSGTTQYVRNNAFIELRDDVADVVDAMTANVSGLTIHQFDCNWRGFPLLEIGDKVELRQVCVDGCVDNSFVLDDVVAYDGTYSQKTQWNYQSSDSETEANNTNIGDAINSTYAKVDKVNREITLVASRVDENTSEIGSLIVNTNSISASVQTVQDNVDANSEEMAGQIETLTKRVDAVMTDEEINFKISTALENGVTSVTTETGYTFDEGGLTVSKSGSEMKTTISEDGMSITRSGEEVLRADNEGVKAEDLHATTYLIIGANSRFEDYTNANGEPRTGCFWIGAVST